MSVKSGNTNLWDRALKQFNNKEYNAAGETLGKMSPEKQNDADILYLMALIKSKLGEYNQAIQLFRKVILSSENKPALSGKKAEANYNIALCYQNLNLFDQALEYYSNALKENPFLSEAHNNRAIIFSSQNRNDEAEKEYRKAIKIKPGNLNAASNLEGLRKAKNTSGEYLKAVALNSAQKYDEALEILKRLLKKNPKDIDVLFTSGIVHFNKNEFEISKKFYEKILELEPDNPVGVYSVGVCYQNMENKESALKYYEKAIELKPDYTDALNNYALLNAELKNFEIAEEYYKRAIVTDPGYFISVSNLGVLKLGQDNFNEAASYFTRAEEIIRDTSDTRKKSIAYCNLGFLYQKQNKTTEALEYFNRAIRLDPSNMLAHYNKAEVHFITGDLSEGWKEYEWRTGRKDFGLRKFKKIIQPGDDICGKKVLVYAEQGLGDALQFVRYFPLLKAKGCYTIFECDKSIFGLLNEYKSIDQLVERNLEKTPDVEYDYEIPLLSLPYYFNTTLQTIPREIPYLSVDKELVSKWKEIINENDKFQIGVIWAGSPIHSNDRHRSVRLSSLQSLFSVEGTKFYSLQKGFPVIQARDYQLFIKILDDYINSFADTAAALENMDLIITVDTSVAHLAGALGKPVWLLIPYHPDWRWMLEREDSPWYPSVRLFRQPKFKDWDSVFIKLKSELEKVVKNIKPRVDLSKKQNISIGYDKTLYLGLTSGENFGWGICSKYLRKELSEKINIINVEEHPELIRKVNIDGKIFHALTNQNFSSLLSVIGTENYGYTFFEHELTDLSRENAKKYEIVIGGSTWNKQKMLEKGITNTDVLIQGIDPELFYPSEGNGRNDDLFIIFSGGKFELRKGQDLVLKAIKVLQQKYNNIILINAWYNMWPNTMQAMGYSPHIKYEYKGETWKNFMINLCQINDIDGNKVFTLPLTPNDKMRDVYLKTDIGLFPNRCEGGTNLVMMEYMACGKPVIASYNTGHTDILNDRNSLPILRQKEFKLYSDDKNIIADWKEPEFDEIISLLEYAYNHRTEIKQLGVNAGGFMKDFTWAKMADNLLKIIK